MDNLPVGDAEPVDDLIRIVSEKYPLSNDFDLDKFAVLFDVVRDSLLLVDQSLNNSIIDALDASSSTRFSSDKSLWIHSYKRNN